MRKKSILRAAALALSLTMALAPLASALTVEEARQLLKDNYIDPIPEEILNLPTIQEITAALGDPYTYYMTAEEYALLAADMNDSQTVGIGTEVQMAADGIHVMRVAPDSPAQKGGIHPGDILVGVDGTTLKEVGSAEALRLLIPGDAGTKVTITVLRDGKTFDVTMSRALVVFPVVTGEVRDGHIGWITCTSFGDKTSEYFKNYIEEEDAAADRWVVDLRGNPGGYADAVIQVAGYVVGNSDVAYVLDKDKNVGAWRPSPFPVEIPPILTEPLIVLTNGNSASASELFSACMRDYQAALIIGTRTFGKGVAQSLLEQEDGSAMRVTTDRYYSPEYVTPDRSGVLPDLVVDPDLADEVAYLLSGKTVKNPGSNVLVIELVGQKWFVHKSAAMDSDYVGAFAELLSALAPDVSITLGGKQVTAAEVGAAWKVVYEDRAFADMDASAYEDEINHLATLGLVSGDENGNFNPQGQLTRAELVSLVSQAMAYWCWNSEGTAPFTDVERDAWYADAVDIMYNLGLISGDDQNRFNPDELIDYQQFLTILSRTGERNDLTVWQCVSDAPDNEAIMSAAVLKFAPWSRVYALTAQELGFVSTPLADMDPTAIVTREEAAVMVYRLLRYTGALNTYAVEAE